MCTFISLVTVPQFGCHKNILARHPAFTHSRPHTHFVAVNFGRINQAVAGFYGLQNFFAGLENYLPSAKTDYWHLRTVIQFNSLHLPSIAFLILRHSGNYLILFLFLYCSSPRSLSMRTMYFSKALSSCEYCQLGVMICISFSCPARYS